VVEPGVDVGVLRTLDAGVLHRLLCTGVLLDAGVRPRVTVFELGLRNAYGEFSRPGNFPPLDDRLSFCLSLLPLLDGRRVPYGEWRFLTTGAALDGRDVGALDAGADLFRRAVFVLLKEYFPLFVLPITDDADDSIAFVGLFALGSRAWYDLLDHEARTAGTLPKMVVLKLPTGGLSNNRLRAIRWSAFVVGLPLRSILATAARPTDSFCSLVPPTRGALTRHAGGVGFVFSFSSLAPMARHAGGVGLDFNESDAICVRYRDMVLAKLSFSRSSRFTLWRDFSASHNRFT
jgi:hypothetical protein